METVQDIVHRAKAGDKEAFGLLYQSYYVPIYRYCRIRLAKKEDAEDIAQDVFVKAWKSFDTFTLRGSTALPFFYTIAKNALIDFRKKKRPIEVLNKDTDDVGSRDIIHDEISANIMAAEETSQKIYSLLATLSENESDAIVMRFIDGLSNAEIATIVGRSEESVRQLQSRGLRKLKSSFKQ